MKAIPAATSLSFCVITGMIGIGVMAGCGGEDDPAVNGSDQTATAAIDESALAEAKALLADGAANHEAALRKLEGVTSPEALAFLLTLVPDSPNWTTSVSPGKLLIERLSAFEDPADRERIVDALMHSYPDVSPYQKARIAEAVVAWAHHEAIATATGHLRGNTWVLPWDVLLDGIIEHNVVEAADELIALAKMDPSTGDPESASSRPLAQVQRRGKLLIALTLVTGPEQSAFLIEELDKLPDHREKTKLATAMIESGHTAIVDYLAEKAGPPDGDPARWTHWTADPLLRSPDPKARAYTDRALNPQPRDNDPRGWRRRALTALAESAGPADIPRLLPALNNDDNTIRELGLKALTRIGDAPDATADGSGSDALTAMLDAAFENDRPRTALLIAQAIGDDAATDRAKTQLASLTADAHADADWISNHLALTTDQIRSRYPDAKIGRNVRTEIAGSTLITQYGSYYVAIEDGRVKFLHAAGNDAITRIMFLDHPHQAVFGIQVGDPLNTVWEIHGPTQVRFYPYRYHLKTPDGTTCDVQYSPARDGTVHAIEVSVAAE